MFQIYKSFLSFWKKDGICCRSETNNWEQEYSYFSEYWKYIYSYD